MKITPYVINYMLNMIMQQIYRIVNKIRKYCLFLVPIYLT
ncbi:MAG: hypothetical protein H6Q58_701 [Firmicutes bacterium]|nr:hypothetical protein [Bacillota bacterium]